MDLNLLNLTNDMNIDIYRQMAELQDKLKKSEEERLKLEEKFQYLMKSFREEEENKFRNLQNRYAKFIEDCCRRNNRNETILKSLDKVETGANIVFAKTERLKLLRKHYEVYLERIMPHWKQQSAISNVPYKAYSSTSLSYKPSYTSRLTSSSGLGSSTSVDPYLSGYSMRYPPAEPPLSPEPFRFEDRHVSRAPSRSYLDRDPTTRTEGESHWDDLRRSLVVEDRAVERTLHPPDSWAGPADRRMEKRLSFNEKTLTRAAPLERFERRNSFASDLAPQMDGLSLRRESVGEKGSGETTEKAQDPEIECLLEKDTVDVDEEVLETMKAELSLAPAVGKLSPEATARFQEDVEQGEDMSVLTKKSLLEHQRSIDKLKAVLSVDKEEEDEQLEERIVQKDEVEGNEKAEETDVTESSSEVWRRDTPLQEPPQMAEDAWQGDPGLEEQFAEMVAPPEEQYLEGGEVYDGEPVDYSNETYPESYYEQPAPRSPYGTNISSNVILEEDEYEVEQERAEEYPQYSQPYPEGEEHYQPTEDECPEQNYQYDPAVSYPEVPYEEQYMEYPQEQVEYPEYQEEPSADQYIQQYDENYAPQEYPEGVDPTYEQNYVQEESGYQEGEEQPYVPTEEGYVEQEYAPAPEEGGEVRKQPSLSHLLESDSESYNIEHGNMPPATEDSDFDFSIGKQ